MKLLKLVLIIFLIYFIRRFIQLYRVMKQVQQAQREGMNQQDFARKRQSANAVDAEYKVID